MRRKSEQRASRYQHKLEVLRVSGSVDAAGHQDYTDADAWEVVGSRWFSLEAIGQTEGDRASQVETITRYTAATPSDTLTAAITTRYKLRASDDTVYEIGSVISPNDQRSEVVLELARASYG